jgi:cyclopropane fatty-acyl-phospholipid synthase-like methyltransferase
MAKAAERLVWAVEMLAVQPDDHLLGIGCGHGVAVSLVCEQLDTGTITAIDRSIWTRPQVTTILQDNGFSVSAVSHKDLQPWPAVGIQAKAV